MNHEKKSPDTRRAILWGVGGAYILYLGYDLLQGYFPARPRPKRTCCSAPSAAVCFYLSASSW